MNINKTMKTEKVQCESCKAIFNIPLNIKSLDMPCPNPECNAFITFYHIDDCSNNPLKESRSDKEL